MENLQMVKFNFYNFDIEVAIRKPCSNKLLGKHKSRQPLLNQYKLVAFRILSNKVAFLLDSIK